MASPLSVISGIVAGILCLTFATVRYLALTRRGRPLMEQAWKATKQGPIPDHVASPGTYIVYVLGSGGHTGEMCEMIKQQFRPDPLSHRRYLITSGDTHSANAVSRLENVIRKMFPVGADGRSMGGSWDVVDIVRARHVHQPLFAAWYTTLLSALSIVQALRRAPKPRARSKEQPRAAFDYPNLIVTNGPGTGFIVSLVAFVLRMLFIIPANRCSVLFIETWAHVSTLSMTGKLFYYSRIADMFVVQHEQLAKNTGEKYIGEVTKYGNLLGIRKSLKSR
ncbi:glycosyltransferase family 1 protein [Ophiostoma piceae UAMH 11346]|uniref:UDP-N-acetylglucosamine transferase subunit ALG14 n=1 Tax=Ophiostoma piceae (strain UAMH 11346) TaxID=1262450 RepID=S3D2X9_OPHP1|nr:glycosyltransferase family 1 protein [Ophiostoma piceae UAMH 11346]